jgi:ornithine--oxo-acid transaminase
MERAVAHGSTFGTNDLAMAAGIATLDVLKSEQLVEKAAQTGERLLRAFTEMTQRYEFHRVVMYSTEAHDNYLTGKDKHSGSG